MKKILFIIGQMSNGGAERVISILANQLCSNYNVFIACAIRDDLQYKLSENIIYIPHEEQFCNKIKRMHRNYSFIKQTIKSVNPDYVISFTTEINIYSIVACRMLKYKNLIISERNDPKKDPKSKFTRFLRKMTYWLGRKYVFQTNYAMNCFSKKIRKNSRIIYNPINYNLPAFCGENSKRIISISRLTKQKNIPLLIKAFADFYYNHTDYCLDIFGDGPDKDELNNLIKELKLDNSVHLRGFSNNIYDELKKSKMFVLTSNYEGISNAMLEALVIGVPTIVTDCPAYGGREFIKNEENGFLVEINDKEAIVKLMNRLADDTEYYSSFVNKNNNLKDDLSSSKIVGEWLEFIENN